MSLAQPPLQERRQSPGLNLQFASNNPFRRAASPTAPSPSSPLRTPTTAPAAQRPTSTNPFLDNGAQPEYFPPPRPRPVSPLKQGPLPLSAPVEMPLRPAEQQTSTLAEVSMSERNRSHRGPPAATDQPPVSNGHRSTLSEEQVKRTRAPAPAGPPRPGRTAEGASPVKAEYRMPRRNSDTSVADVKEEDRKSKDKRQRDPKPRQGRSGKPRRPNKEVDLIDKLDLSGIYGPAMFHHGGPFDACNPHRNRKGMKSAPMMAFAEGSANNALGGSGPVNKRVDYDSYAGRGAEGFTDYNATLARAHDPYLAVKRTAELNGPQTFDPKGRNNRIHGQESLGLGTSTFFEGTPVSRVTLQRQESETETAQVAQPALQRKKSLVQRFRGMSRTRPGVTSPDGTMEQSTSPLGTPTYGVQSAGGRTRVYEMNPFFNEEGEKSGEAVKVTTVDEPVAVSSRAVKAPSPVPTSPIDDTEALSRLRSRTNSSSRRALVRPATNSENDTPGTSGAEGEAKPAAGGLLNRVKSLKGRKARPERS